MSYHQSPADGVLITADITAQIASANVNGSTLDMAGWTGCLFIFNLGTMASGATFDARIVSSANANMAGNANITGAALTQVTTSTPNVALAIDVWRPVNRYIRSAVIPATANSTFSAIAIRYGRNGTLPPTQTMTQVVRVNHV